MPELPEVEVSRRGLIPFIEGKVVLSAVLRTPKLRHVIPAELPCTLSGQTLLRIRRRAKYLLFDFHHGCMILHLGMSGSLRLVAPGTVPEKHDHFDLVFADKVMRLRDPRRFGALLWVEANPEKPPETHPLLATLGVEPLAPEFDGHWLHAALSRRTAPIKPVLMDSHLLVGVGNIYAAESLFRAGISPMRAANRISKARCQLLAHCIQETLQASINAGGSSVRDYVHSDGGAGSFQLSCNVYDRAGQPCTVCTKPIRCARQAGRSTYWCPNCQH